MAKRSSVAEERRVAEMMARLKREPELLDLFLKLAELMTARREPKRSRKKIQHD